MYYIRIHQDEIKNIFPSLKYHIWMIQQVDIMKA